MGVTSSGQISNLERPSSSLKPNAVARPLNYISPDTLYADGYQICNGSEQCLNDWNGGGPGTLTRWYQYGESNPENQWNWWYEGTVSPTQSWPFTAGTGLNNDYDGNPVYKFAYAPDGNGSGNCLSQGLFGVSSTGAALELGSGCPSATGQTDTNSLFGYFVLDGNGRLVAVEATNLYVAYYGNNGNKIWVGVNPNNPTDDNGAYVYLVDDISYSTTGFAATA